MQCTGNEDAYDNKQRSIIIRTTDAHGHTTNSACLYLNMVDNEL